jgi:aminopeptidase N
VIPCRRLLLLLPLLLTAGANAPPDPYPVQRDVDVQHYLFRLELRDESDRIEGVAELTVRFTAAGRTSFALDLAGATPEREGKGMTVQGVEHLTGGSGTPLTWRHEGDRLSITLDRPTTSGQQRRFRITYGGVPADGLIIGRNRYGERTFFGDNWPDRAHHWLPTVDHVADKATCEFVVTAPALYRVIGSGTLVEEADLGEGRRRTHWRSRVPLATKVMVIGAARFAVQELGEVAGVPLSTWVYEPGREEGFRDYAVAARILPYYVATIGPFPYEKLANVQSTTRYGGMENAGNIFYTERARGDLEGLIAHEMAHQWFGDSVTEGDWWHIWLSEGFATYLTELYLESAYGPERLAEDMVRQRRQVVGYFRRNPTAPVIDTTITDLNRLLSTNSYQKGSWFLHMLRGRVGEGLFREGLQAYYARFRDGNALTGDFRRVMEEVSGQELGDFFEQWLYRPGHPVLEAGWTPGFRAGEVRLEVIQTQPGAPFVFPLEVGVWSGGASELRIERFEVDEGREAFRITVASPPDSITLDPRVHLLMEGRVVPPA